MEKHRQSNDPPKKEENIREIMGKKQRQDKTHIRNGHWDGRENGNECERGNK